MSSNPDQASMSSRVVRVVADGSRDPSQLTPREGELPPSVQNASSRADFMVAILLGVSPELIHNCRNTAESRPCRCRFVVSAPLFPYSPIRRGVPRPPSPVRPFQD